MYVQLCTVYKKKKKKRSLKGLAQSADGMFLPTMVVSAGE